MSEVIPTLHDGASLRILETERPVGFKLIGRIDLAERRALETVVRRFLDREGDLYVDLAGLDFIDVGGMRVLFDAAACIADAGRHLVFVGPSSVIKQIIQICGGDDVANVRVLATAPEHTDERRSNG